MAKKVKQLLHHRQKHKSKVFHSIGKTPVVHTLWSLAIAQANSLDKTYCTLLHDL